MIIGEMAGLGHDQHDIHHESMMLHSAVMMLHSAGVDHDGLGRYAMQLQI